MVSREFRDAVVGLMNQVPTGKVTTYGDVAAYAGNPAAARIVGGVAHYGPEATPWHRLVNYKGGLASGYPGGREVQRQLLEHEGVVCSDDYYVIDFNLHRWRRDES
jgi:methylated-DNA-protein-cysteine methyltransferase-like protein